MNATKVSLRLGGACGMALLLAVLAWGKNIHHADHAAGARGCGQT
jgi:hypothetical protein